MKKYKIHKKLGNFFIVENEKTLAMCTSSKQAVFIKKALQDRNVTTGAEQGDKQLQQLKAEIAELADKVSDDFLEVGLINRLRQLSAI